MKQKEIIVPYDSTPHLHTGSFLTKEQAEQFKNAFKDFVQVIRCKDCDNKECWGRAGDVVCGIDGTPHRPDWFCADGKRNPAQTNAKNNALDVR